MSTKHDKSQDKKVDPQRSPLERVATGAAHVGAVLLQIAAVALVVNAIYRYTVGGGFLIISEATRFTFLLVVFLGLAGTHLAGGHVRVEILLSALPKRVQTPLLGYIVPVVSIFFLSLLAWSGWVATEQMYAYGTTTPTRPAILLWPIAAVVPAGSALLIVLLIIDFVRQLFVRGKTANDSVSLGEKTQ